ncbi:hypothetical protein [Oerskovia paurometabola]|uniref:hypothetical protein n=1 Tax=Oerskovia paurometabola TaxID=162170 RepID=UPI0037FF0C99
MRADGSVVSAGDPNQDGLGLPMEEREDRHEVRARHEAKRQRSSSPWADREAPAPGTKEQKAARNARSHDPAREAALFESRPLEATAAPAPVTPVLAATKSHHKPPQPPTPDEVAAIAAGYIAGDSIAALATRHRVTKTVVREVLAATRGLRFRPADLAAPRNRDDDPGLVAAVRRLYELEGLTQREIAERYTWSPVKVRAFMRKHGIEARPPGARPKSASVPAVVDVPPVALPTPEQPPVPPVAMPTPQQPPVAPVAMPSPDPAPRRELTPRQQRALEAFARGIEDVIRGFGLALVECMTEITTALAAPQVGAQDDYTLAGGPE